MTQRTITYQGREVTAGELEAMIGKAGYDNAMGCYERYIEGRRLIDGEIDTYEYLTPSDELITFETEKVDDWEQDTITITNNQDRTMKKRIDTAMRIEEQVREKYAEMKSNDPEALVLFKGRVDYRCYGADVPHVWAAVEKGLKGMGTLYENKEDEFPFCDMAAFQDRYLDKVLPLLVGAGHSVAMVQLEY